MAILVLVFLFAGAAVAIGYPLVSQQAAAASAPSVTDRDIERAVRRLRASGGSDLECPSCGQAYRAGDLFCVKCGADLPGDRARVAPPAGAACPACGVPLRPGDVFCSKCGHRVTAGEGN